MQIADVAVTQYYITATLATVGAEVLVMLVSVFFGITAKLHMFLHWGLADFVLDIPGTALLALAISYPFGDGFFFDLHGEYPVTQVMLCTMATSTAWAGSWVARHCTNGSQYSPEYRICSLIMSTLLSLVLIPTLYVQPRASTSFVVGVGIGASWVSVVTFWVVALAFRIAISARPTTLTLDLAEQLGRDSSFTTSLQHVSWLRWARRIDMVLCDLAANRVGEENLYFFTISMTIVTWIGGAVSVGGIVTLLVMYWPLGPAYLATSLLGLGGLAAFIWLQITSTRVGSMISTDIVSNVVPPEISERLKTDYVSRMLRLDMTTKQMKRLEANLKRLHSKQTRFLVAKNSRGRISKIAADRINEGDDEEGALEPPHISAVQMQLRARAMSMHKSIRAAQVGDDAEMTSDLVRTNSSLGMVSIRRNESVSSATSRGKSRMMSSMGFNLAVAPPVYIRDFEDVGILFMDICDFTELSSATTSKEMLRTLHRFFSTLDATANYLGVFKYTTIGDCYITMSNLDAFGGQKSTDHAVKHLSFAVTALRVANATRPGDGDELDGDDEEQLQTLNVRVGLHIGRITGGVVGSTKQQLTCIGDAMNVSSRMESSAQRNTIQVSSVFYEQLPTAIQAAFTGTTRDVKGKGEMMTYTLNPYDPACGMQTFSSFGLDLTQIEDTWGQIVLDVAQVAIPGQRNRRGSVEIARPPPS